MKKLITIVISAYNEELVLDKLYEKLKYFMSTIRKYDFEVIIVDNGSADKTFEILKKINSKDKRFKIVQLSRNFGPGGGQSAGIKFAKGDALVLMDADLQDPPEVISEFISKWEQGYEITYGVITKRKGVSVIRKIVSPIFYWIIYVFSHKQIPKNATDFRLVDKKVYQQINVMSEHNRYIRGMISWTGFKQIGVPFVRQPRAEKGGGAGGEVDFRLFRFVSRMIKFMSDAIFSFTTFPLKLISLAGVIT